MSEPNTYLGFRYNKSDALETVSLLKAAGINAYTKRTKRSYAPEYEGVVGLYVRKAEDSSKAREFLRGFNVVMNIRGDAGAFVAGVKAGFIYLTTRRRGRLRGESGEIFSRLPLPRLAITGTNLKEK